MPDDETTQESQETTEPEFVSNIGELDFNVDPEPEETSDGEATDSTTDDSTDGELDVSDSTEDQEGETEEGAEGDDTEDTGEEGGEDAGEEATDSDGEGDEGTEEEQKEPDSVSVDGTDVDIDDLKVAWKERSEAEAALKNAKSQTELVNDIVKQIVNTPAQAMLDVFTKVFEGDTRKAYNHLVSISEQIVGKHLELEQLPPEAQDAMFAKQENAKLKRQLEAKEAKEAAEAAAAEEAKLAQQLSEQIGTALEDVKLDSSHVSAVADIMLKASEAGLEVTAAQAAKKYQAVRAKQRKELLESIDPDELPDKVRKALKKKELSKAKTREKAKIVGKRKPKAKSDDDRIIASVSNFGDIIREHSGENLF
jgi:hypothetical protein